MLSHWSRFRLARIFENYYFVKAIEHFFPRLHSLILTFGGLGEFSKVMQTRDVVEGLDKFQ